MDIFFAIYKSDSLDSGRVFSFGKYFRGIFLFLLSSYAQNSLFTSHIWGLFFLVVFILFYFFASFVINSLHIIYF